MAEDKKVNDGNKDGELTKKDRFEILLEDMNKNIKGIAEGHGILLAEVKDGNRKSEERDKELGDMIKSNSKTHHERIDKVDRKIDDVKNELSQRIDKIDQKLDKVDKKIDKLDEKMTIRQDKIEEKVDIVHQKVFGH